jgi:hypothetical protein
MKENKLLLTYGPREAQAFEQVDSLIKAGVLPDNKNEILRRGLHSCVYLTQADEEVLLELLSTYLHAGKDNVDASYLETAKSLAFVVYATMIAKKGILKAETFETIPMNINAIEHAIKHTSPAPSQKDVRKALEELASSVDTLFLKRRKTGNPLDSLLRTASNYDTFRKTSRDRDGGEGKASSLIVPVSPA